MALFIKTNKLTEYTKEVAELKMKKVKKESKLFCCCPMSFLKWNRAKTVATEAKKLKSQLAQLKKDLFN